MARKGANIEWLTKLADMLQNNSKGRVVSIPGDGKAEFNLEEWLKDPHSCDTSACAIGCALLSPEFNAAGFKMSDTDWTGHMEPVYRRLEGWEAVKRFFGLTGLQAEYLFVDYSYPDQDEDPTPKQVAKRLRKFIETGEIDRDLVRGWIS